MIKQYMSSFCVSLVSDGFNIWNAIACLWPSDDSSNGGQSMRSMLTERLGSGLLTLIRPDSGEGVETLPQMMTLLHHALPEHWQKDLAPIQPVFLASDPRAAKYEEVLQKIRANIATPEEMDEISRLDGPDVKQRVESAIFGAAHSLPSQSYRHGTVALVCSLHSREITESLGSLPGVVSWL